MAVISDIHGNLIALEAVLADIATKGADQIVCVGDIASMAPQPVETSSWLYNTGSRQF